MLDGCVVAGRVRDRGRRSVLGKPSPPIRRGAHALAAEPERTWLVTDDVEADVRSAHSRDDERTVATEVVPRRSSRRHGARHRVRSRPLPALSRRTSPVAGLRKVRVTYRDRAHRTSALGPGSRRASTEAEREYCASRARPAQAMRDGSRKEASARRSAAACDQVEGDRIVGGRSRECGCQGGQPPSPSASGPGRSICR